MTTMRLAAALTATISLSTAVPSRGAEEDRRFVDVTQSSGVTFVHETGAFGEKWLPETMGSGVLVLDYNEDGRPDLLFANGRAFTGRPGRDATQALYENLGDLRFREVTASAGLDLEAYCLGGAAADLDNDGDADVYLSCLGTDHLLRNDGGRFSDLSEQAGLTREYEFGASVALLDADRDGLLDVLATRYVTWTPETDIFCTLDGTNKSYCTPEPYQGASPRFYRNLGDLVFEDKTRTAGIYKQAAKSLGAAVLDVNEDGWPDLAVANDTQPNLLYLNDGTGNFEETGVVSGMAFSETGVARGGMGIDAADYDGSGRQSLVIGNFANEMVGLYKNEGNLLFVDVAPLAQVGRPTLLSLTFATFFFDYDLDGHLDLLVANGHLEPEIENIQPNVTYAQPTQLFRNLGDGRFEEVTDSAGGDLATPRVARGAAHADLDGDGDLDVILTVSGGRPALLENRSSTTPNWLRVELEGRKSNRDGLGALVELTAAGRTRSWMVRAGSSYLSQSQLSPTFGLADTPKVDQVTVHWPSGIDQTVPAPPINQPLRVVEEAPQ